MATALLTQLLMEVSPEPLLRELADKIRGRTVIVYGAGPSLPKHIEEIQSQPSLKCATHVAADGAVRALNDMGARCDILVTDLDGIECRIGDYSDEGVLPIVHAHGDNIPLIRKHLSGSPRTLGSTQVMPTERAFLWGGFTDGDRACHIVTHYSPVRVLLAGMDFGRTVGRWSKPSLTENRPADARKRTKMQIGMELLERLASRTGQNILFM
ncbi:MAG: DUF115 domain-containing protein [Candidatus Thorarchaeota archaeon]|nr:DUF115 domain-containing protein [Candidatus Thorarchaeota archaeon]